VPAIRPGAGPDASGTRPRPQPSVAAQW